MRAAAAGVLSYTGASFQCAFVEGVSHVPLWVSFYLALCGGKFPTCPCGGKFPTCPCGGKFPTCPRQDGILSPREGWSFLTTGGKGVSHVPLWGEFLPGPMWGQVSNLPETRWNLVTTGRMAFPHHGREGVSARRDGILSPPEKTPRRRRRRPRRIPLDSPACVPYDHVSCGK